MLNHQTPNAHNLGWKPIMYRPVAECCRSRGKLSWRRTSASRCSLPCKITESGKRCKPSFHQSLTCTLFTAFHFLDRFDHCCHGRPSLGRWCLMSKPVAIWSSGRWKRWRAWGWAAETSAASPSPLDPSFLSMLARPHRYQTGLDEERVTIWISGWNTELSLLQLDIEAEFVIDEAALMATTEADVGYNCSTSGGAAARGMLGPFGLLVLADKALSEQTAVYFYVARGRDGRLRAHFCQDESRHVLLTSVVPFASITCSYRDIWLVNAEM